MRDREIGDAPAGLAAEEDDRPVGAGRRWPQQPADEALAAERRLAPPERQVADAAERVAGGDEVAIELPLARRVEVEGHLGEHQRGDRAAPLLGGGRGLARLLGAVGLLQPGAAQLFRR